MVVYGARNLFVDDLFDQAGNEDPIACEDFEFDRTAWNTRPDGGFSAPRVITERERIADAFHRCGTLHGLKRAEVEAMIGQGSASKRKPNVITYDIGWVNDAIGPGDSAWMTLVYEDGRVANLPGRESRP